MLRVRALLPGLAALLMSACSAAPQANAAPAVPRSGTSASRSPQKRTVTKRIAPASPGNPYHGWYPDAVNGKRIPGGQACLNWLRRLGIAFTPLGDKPWVQTPVLVTGPIGGIFYRGQGKASVVLDCRMVLALDWSARALKPLGITAVEHFSDYSVRNTRSGRLSLHARGLALDIGAVRVGERWLYVKREFQRRAGCSSHPATLNALACQLRGLHLFRELITPDDDGDHRDHVHLGLELLSPR